MSSIPADETKSLRTINRRLPPDVHRRYEQLKARLRAETLTSEEHKELISLTDQVEQMNVEQIEALVKLGQLWHMSLRETMDKLGIRPPPYE